MAGNPQVPQGTLNLLKGAVQWTQNDTLNVTASFLGESGIRMRFNGPATEYRKTLVGGVPSPQPVQIATVMIPLLKTQQLGLLYKQQFETNTFMGDCTIRPDASPMSPWQLVNCSLMDVDELALDGSTPVYMVSAQGYYQVNNQLWDLI